MFLIVKVKSAPGVRFDGRGFFALSGQSQNPAELSYGLQHPHAIVPLHTAFSASSGRIEIILSTAGQLEFEWAVVERAACGERVLAQGALQPVSIAPGSPRIVPRDEFVDTKPLRRLQALQGDYELLEFKNRYEVYNKASGELILKRQGRLPTFSPTGRFLSARPPLEGTFEVIDLTARVVLGRYRADELAWSHGDSFLYVVGSRLGQFWVVRALHGLRDDVARAQLSLKGLSGKEDSDTLPPKLQGPDLEPDGTSGGLFGVATWQWEFDLSITDGTLIVAESDRPGEIVAYDVGTARPKEVVGSVSAVAGSETEMTKKIERSIGLEQPKLSGWNVGEPLWLTAPADKELREKPDWYLKDLKEQRKVRLDATAKILEGIPPVSAATTRKVPRARTTKLRSAGDYETVIGLSLPFLEGKKIAGIRSGRDPKTTQQIGREIAKLYSPDVAIFKRDDPWDAYRTQKFVDPSIKPESDTGPAVFTFASKGRDLWRFAIGATTYWLTQTVESGRNGHTYDFTLLSSSPSHKPQFADLIALANDAGGFGASREGWEEGPFSQSQDGDMRMELDSKRSTRRRASCVGSLKLKTGRRRPVGDAPHRGSALGDKLSDRNGGNAS